MLTVWSAIPPLTGNLILPPKIPPTLREEVRRRANFLCEYCHTDERWQLVQFTIDHIIPLSEGGKTSIENLALACFHCNRKKSNKQSVVDSTTNIEIRLFNPRAMIWNDHFIWSIDGLKLFPQTDIGRATIELLQLNRDRILQIRQDDILIDRHPPAGDSIQVS